MLRSDKSDLRSLTRSIRKNYRITSYNVCYTKLLRELLFERLRDFIDGDPAFVAVNHEPNTFFPVSTQVTLNGSAGFAEQGSRAIDTNSSIRNNFV